MWKICKGYKTLKATLMNCFHCIINSSIFIYTYAIADADYYVSGLSENHIRFEKLWRRIKDNKDWFWAKMENDDMATWQCSKKMNLLYCKFSAYSLVYQKKLLTWIPILKKMGKRLCHTFFVRLILKLLSRFLFTYCISW